MGKVKGRPRVRGIYWKSYNNKLVRDLTDEELLDAYMTVDVVTVNVLRTDSLAEAQKRNLAWAQR